MKNILLTTLLGIIFLAYAPHTHASSVMTIVPDKTQVAVNELVTANVFLNTGGANINNAEGVISFSPTNLVVESISTAGSIFSIWVEQPAYSNATGIISFNGGVPNPGFNGAQGLVVRVQFRAKSAGAIALSISSAGIYANDGLGTNVTSANQATQGTTVIQIGPAGQTPTQVPVTETVPVFIPPVLDVPAPVLTTSPDEDEWYSTTTALFAWTVPRGVSSVQLLHGLRAESTPTVLYTPAISRKLLTKLEDGVQYFHIRFRSGTTWSDTVHHKFQIDTTAPTIETINSRLTTEDRIEIALEATDKTSGIRRYEAYANAEKIGESTVTPFVLQPLAAGGQTVAIRAYDAAGNYTEKTTGVMIPELRAPRITLYPASVQASELFRVEGTSYADTDIRVGISVNNGEAQYSVVRSRADGTFTWEGKAPSDTTELMLWAEAVRTEKIVSPASERITIDVNTNILSRFGVATIDILSLAIPITLALLALIFLAVIGVHKIRATHHAHNNRLTGGALDTHKVFSVIKDDVQHAINLFENNNARRKRTVEEEETIAILKKDLEEAEKYFTERLKK